MNDVIVACTLAVCATFFASVLIAAGCWSNAIKTWKEMKEKDCAIDLEDIKAQVHIAQVENDCGRDGDDESWRYN